MSVTQERCASKSCDTIVKEGGLRRRFAMSGQAVCQRALGGCLKEGME